MMKIRITHLVSVAVLAATLAACTSTETVGSLPPVSGAPPVSLASPTTSLGAPIPTPSGASGSAAPLPSPVPMHPTSMAGNSRAQVKGPDGLVLNLDFPRMEPYSYYSGPNEQSSLDFIGENTSSLSIGGFLHEGTQKTSMNAALALTFIDPTRGPLSMTSGDGSCRIAITDANAETIAGSFRCQDVKMGQGVRADVTGLFSSNAPSEG